MSETVQIQSTHLFIPNRDSQTTELCIPIRPERRRTPRKHIPIPLFVYGYSADGQTFYEETSTIAVNLHGGSMRMEAGVQLGQRLLVTNPANEHVEPCIVVFVGARLNGAVNVAFSFTAAMPSFWHCGADGEPEEAAQAWEASFTAH